MNFTDENQIDDMLDRIARLGSDDAALSDADIEALLDNPDAIEAFRQLGALQSGTRQALQPDVPDVDAEWQRLQQRLEGDGHRARTVAIGGWHKWAAIAACAAAIVAVVALVWPTGSAFATYSARPTAPISSIPKPHRLQWEPSPVCNCTTLTLLQN